MNAVSAQWLRYACSVSSWCPPTGSSMAGGRSSFVSVDVVGTVPHASDTFNGRDASVIPSSPKHVLLHPIAAGTLPAFSKRIAHVLGNDDDDAELDVETDADVVVVVFLPQTLVQLLTFLPAHVARSSPTSLLPCTPPSWLIAMAAAFEYVASVWSLMAVRLPEISKGADSTAQRANWALL